MTVQKLLVCTFCGHSYTHINKSVAYRLPYITNMLSTHKLTCTACKRNDVISQQITADISHNVFFDEQKETVRPREPIPIYDSEEEFIILKLTWSCEGCLFSWCTEEVFISEHTILMQIAILTADKRCPDCRSDNVTLFKKEVC